MDATHRAQDAGSNGPPSPIESKGEQLAYNDADVEPELHMRTYIATAAMFTLNMVQVFALQGPPVVVSIYTQAIKVRTLRINAAVIHRKGSQ